jgi:FkbM family methyltransferase
MKIFNFLIHICLKNIVNIIFYKRHILYYKLIQIFSFGNLIYTFDGLKVHKAKKSLEEDITYRYTVSGLYMGEFQQKLLKIKKDFIFLDIGSNIGYFSLVAGKNEKSYKIFSIEPNPKVKKYLDKNLYYNFPKNKYKTYNFAISKRVGSLNFYINNFDSGSSSLIKKNKNEKTIKIKSNNYKLFNEIAKNYPKKNVVVKIDVEGKDLEVHKEIKKSKLFQNIVYIYIETKNNKKDISNIKKNLKNFYLKKKYPIIKNLQSTKQLDLEFIKKNEHIF